MVTIHYKNKIQQLLILLILATDPSDSLLE